MSPEKSGFKKQKSDATDTAELDSQITYSTLRKPHEHSQFGSDGQPITGNVQFPDQATAKLINKGKQLATDIIQGTQGTQTPDTGLGPQEDSASSSASKKERFKTANGRDYEISGPVEGSYLDAEFERKILRQEGFADDEVHMVEPPSFDYNPLGYALFERFKRGTITSEDAKKVFDDNFVPDTCEQGQVFHYNPLTKTLTGGRIESISDDGKITAIRRQWRSGGAIWRHHPDLLGKGWKAYREKTPWESKLLAAFENTNKDIEQVHKLYEKDHYDHIKNSKKEIVETAQFALSRVPPGQSKKALLLGVGNCLDMPLQELAKVFDEITVIEIDSNAAEKAIAKLEPNLQKKFDVRSKDLTGVILEYYQNMIEDLDSSELPPAFIRKARKIAGKITAKAPGRPPNVGNDYAFVCSQLVLSQLMSIPSDHIGSAVLKKFGSRDLYDDHASHDESYLGLVRTLQQEHIRYLARSVAPSGTVHFADTYRTEIRSSPTESKPTVVEIVSPKDIQPVLENTFNLIRKPTRWFHDQTPGKLQFEVKSHGLTLIQGTT